MKKNQQIMLQMCNKLYLKESFLSLSEEKTKIIHLKTKICTITQVMTSSSVSILSKILLTDQNVCAFYNKEVVIHYNYISTHFRAQGRQGVE